MTKNQPKTTKRIKGWGVVHLLLRDLADTVFKTKREAHAYLRENAHHSNSLIMKKVLRHYKVVPVTISYSLSQPKKLKKNKHGRK